MCVQAPALTAGALSGTAEPRRENQRGAGRYINRQINWIADKSHWLVMGAVMARWVWGLFPRSFEATWKKPS